MKHGNNLREALIRAINDTKNNDTIGAIVGAAVGALHGKGAIPEMWIKNHSGRTSFSDDGRVFELLDSAKRLWSLCYKIKTPKLKIRMNPKVVTKKYEVIRGEAGLPLLAHVPHSSTIIPPDVRKTLTISDVALSAEILEMTDWFVDELFSCVPEMGGVSIIYEISRLVVDPERFEDDRKEIMVSKGMGVIYTKTCHGDDLRAVPDTNQRVALLDRFYRPYHRALEKEVKKMLDHFGFSLILDCHSFPSKPLPYEIDQDPDRPDICLGTNSFHTPTELTSTTREFFRNSDLTVAIDKPFAETFVPLNYHQSDSRVFSLMVEINRKLYMDEKNGQKLESFGEMKSMIAHMVDHIGEDFLRARYKNSKQIRSTNQNILKKLL